MSDSKFTALTADEIVEIDGTEYEFVFEASMGEVTADIRNWVDDESTGMLTTIPLDQFTVSAATKPDGSESAGGKNRLQPNGGLSWTTANNLQDDGSKNATWYTPYTMKQLKAIHWSFIPLQLPETSEPPKRGELMSHY